MLCRNFNAPAPGKKYVTDITSFEVDKQRYYLSVILDLYNRQVVAHHHQASMEMSLVEQTVRNLFSRVDKLDGAVLHSDQGAHYTARYLQEILQAKGVVQSMSRKASPLDNAVIESFFGHLKCESVYGRELRTTAELAEAIEEYLYFYNHERPHSRLEGKAPVEYLDERLSS